MAQSIQRRATDFTDTVGFAAGTRICFFTHSVQTDFSGPTHLPVQWVSWALYLGLKRPGSKTDYSPSYSAEAKNDGAIPPLTHMSSWRDECELQRELTRRKVLTFRSQRICYRTPCCCVSSNGKF
jgi:hypothetical protein